MKSVLITGVSGGIGTGLSDFFKERGYYVYGIDTNDSFPASCDSFFSIDLNELATSEIYRIQKFQELSKIMSLNCLINNAAVQLLNSTEEIKLLDWQRTLNINLTAPLILSQFFLHRITSVNGSIVNIGSIHASLTKPNFVSYATSKSALIGLTQAMAVDLNGKVRINSISPAAVETDMLLEGFNFDRSILEKLKGIHPSRIIGKPSDIGAIAYFLAESNIQFLNGVDIKIDGGISKVLKDL